MKDIYSIRISTDAEKHDAISTIIGVTPNFGPYIWGLEIEKLQNEPFDFVSYFLSLLEGKYEALNTLGIHRSDISIWHLYEYEEQCNLEISPEQMTELGSAGITLCISCWSEDD